MSHSAWPTAYRWCGHHIGSTKSIVMAKLSETASQYSASIWHGCVLRHLWAYLLSVHTPFLRAPLRPTTHYQRTMWHNFVAQQYCVVTHALIVVATIPHTRVAYVLSALTQTEWSNDGTWMRYIPLDTNYWSTAGHQIIDHHIKHDHLFSLTFDIKFGDILLTPINLDEFTREKMTWANISVYDYWYILSVCLIALDVEMELTNPIQLKRCDERCRVSNGNYEKCRCFFACNVAILWARKCISWCQYIKYRCVRIEKKNQCHHRFVRPEHRNCIQSIHAHGRGQWMNKWPHSSCKSTNIATQMKQKKKWITQRQQSIAWNCHPIQMFHSGESFIHACVLQNRTASCCIVPAVTVLYFVAFATTRVDKIARGMFVFAASSIA